MADRGWIDKSILTDIADAIRTKTGSTATMTPSEMAALINSIETGGGSGGDDESLKGIIERTATNPTLPSDLTSIGDYAFYRYTNLALPSLPSGITSIGNNAFYYCTNLKTITFEGTPTGTISSSAFKSCTNLTTINVPWAEGAVANAPWGATNATINYNYTGEE